MALPPVRRTTGDVIADRRFAYAGDAFADGDHVAARDLAAQTLERAPAFAPAHALLGRAEAALGQREAAIAALTAALTLEPEDSLGVTADLARLGAARTSQALSPAHVRALFDQYAPHFDQHLVEGLGYRGPQVLRHLLEQARALPAERAIDLGCGTGLMGRELAGVTDRILGIDLSPRMADLARASGAYAEVLTGDNMAELARQPAASADLIVAADVLVYTGDLAPLMAEVARVLAPHGRFAATVQALADPDDAGYRLGEDGRYAHAAGYLRATLGAAGLVITREEACATRLDRGQPVPGIAFVARLGS